MKKNLLANFVISKGIKLLMVVTILSIVGCKKDKEIEYGSITGYVTDANSGEPLRNVDLTLSPIGLSTVSGSDGRYEFVDLDPELYTVQASKRGYQTNTKVVQVRSGKVTSGDVMLTPSSAEMSLSVQRIDFGESETVQYFQIRNNSSNGTISWNISLLSGTDWLTVSPLSGNTGAGQQSVITLTVDRTRVTGSASVNLKVTNTTSGSEITIPVSVGYNSNVLSVSPTNVDFGSSAVSKSITLSNTGGSVVTWQIDYNCAWLTVTPTSGTLSSGGNAIVNLALNRSVLNGQGSTYLQVRNVNDGSLVNVNVMANTSGGGGGTFVVPGGLMAYYTFDNSNCNDMTQNGVNASGVNNPTYPGDGGSGHYLFLNAMQGQYMNIPYNMFNGLNVWSVSFWIKDFGPGCIFAAQYTNNSSEYYDIPFFYASQNGKFAIKGHDCYESYATQFSYNYQTQGIQSNGWHHLVVTMNNGTTKLYIDGSRVDQATISYSSYLNSSCTKVVFGGDKEGGYATKSSMKLDNIRFYNREINSVEVQTIYNNEL